MTRHILVVDDSRTQLERLRLLLEGAGYEVQTAADGQEGLNRVQSSRPDLIVSDLVMPRMDGLAFCRAVRASSFTRRTPFILVTERAAPEDIVKGLEAGADNFIPKPYDEDELLARIKRILEQLDLRGHDHLGVEVRLQVGDRELTVTADKQQIMELLFSAVEALGKRTDDLVRVNRELEQAAAEAGAREAALARSEAMYRRLARNFPNGAVLVFDRDFRFTLLEGTILRTLTREELEGKTLREAAEPALAEIFEPLFRSALTGSSNELEFASSADQVCLIRVVPVEGEERRIVAGMAVVIDITRRKRDEEALLQARDEAERANRAKDEFLSRMSHELRTPLNAILGFSQLLEIGDLGPDHRESVEQITKAGRHLQGLIDEVLDISRIARGHLSLSPEPVAVTQAVNETVELVRSLAAKRRIECRVEEADGFHVLADRQRLKQVLLNLLSNAIKYNREGGKVTVSWAKGPDTMLLIKVADTGLGIPRERMERLFSEFDRLGAEQTDVEGTGLGLCLSRGLAQAMGGTITVESKVGTGSVFTVELPLAEPPVQRQARELEEKPASHQWVAGPRTVLCVEDNPSNLKLIERIFRDRSEIKLLSAMQGRIALELAREHQPDLILLDSHLPDIPGTEVLRCLREDPATRQIPVLALSGDATETQINKLLAAGARDYITKPFDLRKFLDTVEEVLQEGANPPSS
jgi:PAS domain S-box-containing protein